MEKFLILCMRYEYFIAPIKLNFKIFKNEKVSIHRPCSFYDGRNAQRMLLWTISSRSLLSSLLKIF